MATMRGKRLQDQRERPQRQGKRQRVGGIVALAGIRQRGQPVRG